MRQHYFLFRVTNFPSSVVWVVVASKYCWKGRSNACPLVTCQDKAKFSALNSQNPNEKCGHSCSHLEIVDIECLLPHTCTLYGFSSIVEQSLWDCIAHKVFSIRETCPRGSPPYPLLHFLLILHLIFPACRLFLMFSFHCLASFLPNLLPTEGNQRLHFYLSFYSNSFSTSQFRTISQVLPSLLPLFPALLFALTFVWPHCQI